MPTKKISPTLRAFIKATRPRTFPLAIASIICGSALGFSQLAHTTGITWHNWLVLVLTFWVALALQILSNLANDYGDGVKGTDNQRDKLSPERMVATGQLSPVKFKRLIYVWAFLTFWSGVALIAIGFDNLQDFLVFLAFGIIAILAAMAYTMGKRPYGYRAMGELAVLIFFGWLAVLGSAYLQTGEFQPSHLLPATGCGGLAACVLYVNNMRDVYSDKQAGKVTIAVMLGEQKMQTGYYLLTAISLICYLAYALFYNPYTALFILALPVVFQHLKTIQSTRIKTDIKTTHKPILHSPAKTLIIGTQLKVIVIATLIINLLFAIGIVISHYL